MKTIDYTITTASWRDLNPVRQLEQVCFPQDVWPFWDIVGVLTLPNVIRLKAVNDGSVLGFIAADVRRLEDISWIATVGVLPEHRGQGIGTALINACEAQIPTRSVRLCVRMTNEEAIRLYYQLGYRKISIWPRYYQDKEDAVVMEKLR
jgi:ribosomal-protein-alanine N-acetyltransferase